MTHLTSRRITVPSEKMASLAINKSRMKCYGGDKYYLSDGDEFQLELFNPTKYTLKADIKIGGELISQAGIIVFPGQRIWLERYIDTNRKFQFVVYEYDANDYIARGAVSENGNIEVSFFKEVIRSSPSYTYTYTWPDDWQKKAIPNDILYESGNDSVRELSFTCSTPNMQETGKVGQGGLSDQKFISADMDFEIFPIFQESFKILPISKKPLDAVSVYKQYCTSCGKKRRKSDNFCSKCGTKY